MFPPGDFCCFLSQSGFCREPNTGAWNSEIWYIFKPIFKSNCKRIKCWKIHVFVLFYRFYTTFCPVNLNVEFFRLHGRQMPGAFVAFHPVLRNKKGVILPSVHSRVSSVASFCWPHFTWNIGIEMFGEAIFEHVWKIFFTKFIVLCNMIVHLPETFSLFECTILWNAFLWHFQTNFLLKLKLWPGATKTTRITQRIRHNAHYFTLHISHSRLENANE